MLTKEQYEKIAASTNPYLKFYGPIYNSTPREFIQIIDTIKLKSEWDATGIFADSDKNNYYHSIERNGLFFRFIKILVPNSIEIEAIETGKKCTQTANDVWLLVLQGCRYEDFVYLPGDIIDFCEAQKSEILGRRNEAVSHSYKAFSMYPSNVQYADLYFRLRLQNGDLSVIKDAIEYYKYDFDSLVHSERIYEFIKCLTKNKKFAEALELINSIDKGLDELIEGKTKKGIFARQGKEWYVYQKEKFSRKTEKTKLRLTAKLKL